MYKLLTSTADENESGFVRNLSNRGSKLKGDHAAAQIGHMYMMGKMSYLFGFVNDLEKIIYGLGFKLILKQTIMIELYTELMLVLVQWLLMVI